MIGGLLLGYGSRLAYGCNIGADLIEHGAGVKGVAQVAKLPDQLGTLLGPSRSSMLIFSILPSAALTLLASRAIRPRIAGGELLQYRGAEVVIDKWADHFVVMGQRCGVSGKPPGCHREQARSHKNSNLWTASGRGWQYCF